MQVALAEGPPKLEITILVRSARLSAVGPRIRLCGISIERAVALWIGGICATRRVRRGSPAAPRIHSSNPWVLHLAKRILFAIPRDQPNKTIMNLVTCMLTVNC